MRVEQVGGVTIVQGDAMESLRLLDDQSVNCCVTSPPYWGLRDYGVAGQLGLESTPQEYVEKMVTVFREVRRVLRDDGTLWLNLGDTYGTGTTAPRTPGKRGIGASRQLAQDAVPRAGGMAKQLLGIPWKLAFALQADGWYLRQDIIWAKPNPMPESVRDRCTKSHEYIFLLSKRERYYFDAEAIKEPSVSTYKSSDFIPKSAKDKTDTTQVKSSATGASSSNRTDEPITANRNRRSVWTVTTKPFKGAHFATFPPDLIEPCILAGTSEKGACPHCGAPWRRVVEKGAPDLEHQIACGGDAKGEYDGESTKDYATAGAQDASATKARILAGMVTKITTGWVPSCKCPPHEPVPCFILDPFAGAGTVGLMANKHGRKSLLLELNPEYCQIAATRLAGAK